MIPLHTMIRQLRRLPRPVRIAHLRAVIPNYPERSVRRHELEEMLKFEVLGQLLKEARLA